MRGKKNHSSSENKMNLHRMNQLFFFCLLRWDGERWEGGYLRAQTINKARARYSTLYPLKPPLESDDEVIAWACDHSKYFLGMWRLLDIEIRIAVEPFVLWEQVITHPTRSSPPFLRRAHPVQGDFRYFLNALPAMCALVASAHKPKVFFPMSLPICVQ